MLATGGQWAGDMNTTALINRVALAIQDASFDDDAILGYINEGVEAVAGEVPLPALETETTIDSVASQGFTELPEDFQTHLRYVYSNKTRRKITILSSLVRLREETPELEGGLIKRCAVAGNLLYYAPAPAEEEELLIIYHAKPEEYANSTGEDAIIPSHIGPRILLAYACKEIYEFIEDGVDGQKVNVARWEQKYQEALEELKMFLGPLYNRPTGEMAPTDMMRL